MNFLEKLQHGILADGAIGTELYKSGVFVNRCYDSLNLQEPARIKAIHQVYFDAGARLIETNTFTANRLALAEHGLEDDLEAINAAGVRLAKEVVGEQGFVAGAMGPISWFQKQGGDARASKAIFVEQVSALSKAGADVILLETFLSLDELALALEATKSVTSLPVMCQVSLKFTSDEEFEGLQPEKVVSFLEERGADVIGVNCSDGPIGIFEALKRMSAVSNTPLSAMPNAGMPKMVQGRMLYMVTPEYIAEYARRYAQLGVKLIGGCCGTTPEHIREMARFLKGVWTESAREIPSSQKESKSIVSEKNEARPAIATAEKSPFGAKIGKEFLISVEIEPPASIHPDKAVEGARILKEMGVNAVNISDGPRAMARMSAVSLSMILKEQVGIETITHYCCRDRNLLGMQMDLMGQAALGLKNLMLITGDPPKMGHYPDATPVFDLDAIGLIRGVSHLNQGLDFSGRPMKDQTSFLIGCGVNPGAVDLDLEAERYRRKVEAGAEFVFSQPVYDIKLLETFLGKIKNVKPIPFFVGVLPLASLRNAEFLHNEVPGMQIPNEIMKAMQAASTKEAQREVGLEIARDALVAAKSISFVRGAYVFPPFRSYQAVEKLIEVIR